MTWGREYGVLSRRGGEGERWAKRRWASRLQPPSLRTPRDRLRGCIACLLPDHKPPTKTLMSNVNGDNASDSFFICDLFTQNRRLKISKPSRWQKRIIFLLINKLFYELFYVMLFYTIEGET